MRKRLITIGVVVVILGALIAGWMTVSRSATEALRQATRTTEVKRGELTYSISVSGTVQSEETYKVYSMLSFSVDEIFVQEGDYVSKGEILAQLDTESLELDIRQQIAALDSTETNTDLDINSRLSSYQDAQTRSSQNVGNAGRTYELLASQVNAGTHPELIGAQNAVDNARQDLDNKTQAYEDSQFLFELGELSQLTLDNSLTALEVSQRAYDLAVTNQRNLVRRLSDDVESARRSYETTRLAAEQEVANARRMYENAVAGSSNEAAKINLEKLEKQLRDATITAPISGTVTKVYASVGNPGNGLLFIIDDLHSLEIVTKVREYDVANVEPGMPVLIRSDATGNRDIQGTVKQIASASDRTAAGVTIPANVVEYETIVTVDESDSGLKIGMNTRLSIVLESKEDVFYVPYDAVIEGEDGDFRLFVVDETETGGHVARSIPVNVGLETDFAAEVWGEGLFEGLVIISEPFSITEGAEVRMS